MKELIKRFIKDEKGLETVEYAIMVALITLVLVGAILALSGTISDAFNQVGNEISTSGTQ